MLPFQYKVMHIISGDLWAGAEVQAFNLICALSKNGSNILVILFNTGVFEQKLAKEKIPVEVIDENKLSSFAMLRALMQTIEKHKPDIIHSHGFKENILSAIAGKLKSNAIMLRTEHGDNEFITPFWKPHKKLQHFLNRITGSYLQQGIVAVSAPLAKVLTRRHRKDKIFVIENAINIKNVQKASKLEINTHYPQDKIKLACVGRLIPLKRQDLLLSMMTELIKIHNNVELYLYGDGPERDHLITKQKQLKLTKHVKFMGNIDPIYPHLNGIDILLMPSDHEGLPMTILEAMALRVAIAAHAVGGIPKALNNGENGLLVHEHSAQGYLGATLSIIENSIEKNRRRENAFQYLNEHYSIDKQVHQYDQLYLKLLSQRQ